MMAEVVAAGKAQDIGLSEVTAELSLWTRDVLAEVLPYCQEQGIAFLPFSPLGRGFLAGGSRRSTSCPRTTSSAGCRASSRTRCAVRGETRLVGLVEPPRNAHSAAG